MSFKRVIPTCAPDHECSDEEISALLTESRQVYNDETIKNYTSPTVEELKEIITVAEKYSGEWYHSNVSIAIDRNPNNTVYEALVQKVETLGAEAGIYLTWWKDAPELDKIFNKTV